MSIESDYPHLFALHCADDRLSELFRWLSSQEQVRDVRTEMRVSTGSDYMSGMRYLQVSQGVGAELPTGNGISFSVDIWVRDDGCCVEATVELCPSDGGVELFLATLQVEAPSSLAIVLERAADLLLNVRVEKLEEALRWSEEG